MKFNTCIHIYNPQVISILIFQYFLQTGIVAWGVECGKKDIPGVYADVNEGLCFIDWATKCHFGESNQQEIAIEGCGRRWAKQQYCETQNEIETLSDLVSISKF